MNRAVCEETPPDVSFEPIDWPPGPRPRAQTVRVVMTHADAPLTVNQVAQHLHRALSERQ